ncbi:MAG: PadR family transcriptional regulator [Streptosporangiaceae bacterium]
MANDSAVGPAELRELRRGVLAPCVLALLESRPRFGLELVRDLAAADGLLTSDGTVYPLLNRLRDAGLVTSDWQAAEGQRPRRYYSITPDGRASLAAFRSEWARFSQKVTNVLGPASQQAGSPSEPPRRHVDPGAEQRVSGSAGHLPLSRRAAG